MCVLFGSKYVLQSHLKSQERILQYQLNQYYDGKFDGFLLIEVLQTLKLSTVCYRQCYMHTHSTATGSGRGIPVTCVCMSIHN